MREIHEHFKLLTMREQINRVDAETEDRVSRIPLKINNHEQIDQMVYQLYGLTDEEIKVVEEINIK